MGSLAFKEINPLSKVPETRKMTKIRTKIKITDKNRTMAFIQARVIVKTEATTRELQLEPEPNFNH